MLPLFRNVFGMICPVDSSIGLCTWDMVFRSLHSLWSLNLTDSLQFLDNNVLFVSSPSLLHLI